MTESQTPMKPGNSAHDEPEKGGRRRLSELTALANSDVASYTAVATARKRRGSSLS